MPMSRTKSSNKGLKRTTKIYISKLIIRTYRKVHIKKVETNFNNANTKIRNNLHMCIVRFELICKNFVLSMSIITTNVMH